MTVVDSLPHGQWAEEEGPARVGGGETMRREIRFGNEICISSLILRSATDLRGECLIYTIALKMELRVHTSFFPNSPNLWRTALLATDLPSWNAKCRTGLFLSIERTLVRMARFRSWKKRGERNLFVLSDEEMAFRNGDYVKDLSRGQPRHVPLDRSAQPRSSSHEEG